MDEKLGRAVTRVVLPRVVMHSRFHYGVKYTKNSSYFQADFICITLRQPIYCEIYIPYHLLLITYFHEI